MEETPEDIAKILGPNEQVELYIKQKIYHPKINIDSVVITNERIILRHPHTLGLRKDYTDFNYQDIANVVLDKGLVRSTVRCTLRLGGEPLALERPTQLRCGEGVRADQGEPCEISGSFHSWLCRHPHGSAGACRAGLKDLRQVRGDRGRGTAVLRKLRRADVSHPP